MKKLVYILFLFVAVLVFDSCSKENVTTANAADPFAIDDNKSRGLVGHDDYGGLGDGAITDPDEDDKDMDQDDDEVITDPDKDDKDMDEDDDETIVDDRNGEEGF